MKKINISTEAILPYIAKIEKLPKTQRLVIFFGSFLLIIGAFSYLSFWPNYQSFQKINKELEKLDKQLAEMKVEAAKLPMYEKQMEESRIQFALVKSALPEKKEIPGLLTSISQSGHDSGLEFLLFQPQKETQKDFYAEIPVAITVTGSYHNLGQFLSKVASLSRVVNIRDLALRPEKDLTVLKTTCTAVTYRFSDMPAEPKKGKSKPKKKK
ncbi:MAG: type 4a pilus biogenesis protein PilO [Proteobacteria bacterium]|nr:type 4a pilus biogenesis protein PilO [Pseudomonadota bacterium]MBU4469620.1 type 4a pilus biogenesis protein PilO [Pseudomonadota bacterium]MCG2753298.1 type 4a pilus biogenesis protein PilO [Desulfobacteraceae bacterium]